MRSRMQWLREILVDQSSSSPIIQVVLPSPVSVQKPTAVCAKITYVGRCVKTSLKDSQQSPAMIRTELCVSVTRIAAAQSAVSIQIHVMDKIMQVCI